MSAPGPGAREPGGGAGPPVSTPGAPGPRWGFVRNPRAGGAGNQGRLERIRAEFRRAGVEVRETPTEGPGHAAALAREHAAAGAPVVFCWGGDGTLAEAARGLLDTGTALAPLPGGTMNVLAREVGLPRQAPRAVRALLAGRVVTIRPGRVRPIPAVRPGGAGRPTGEPAEPEGPRPGAPGADPDAGADECAGADEYAGAGTEPGVGRPFLSMCSAGLDAAVVRRVAERGRPFPGRGGLAPWIRAGLAVFASASVPRLRVRLLPAEGMPPADGREGPDDDAGAASGAVSWVGVGNQRRYARYLKPFPGARLEDPHLVATVVRSRTRFAVPLVAAASLAGLAQHLPGVRVCRVAGVRVEPADDAPGEVPDWQADGDPVAAGAVEIAVGPQRLRLLVPGP